MSLESFTLGFIAGEGSFYIAVKHRNSGNVTFTPAFSLRVAENEIIEKLAEEIDIGKVYDRPDEDKGLTWKVNAVDECLELAEWIAQNSDEYWKATHKHEQFETWREALMLKVGGLETPEDKKEMVDLSFEIARTNTRKISKDDWYERIDAHHT